MIGLQHDVPWLHTALASSLARCRVNQLLMEAHKTRLSPLSCACVPGSTVVHLLDSIGDSELARVLGPPLNCTSWILAL